MIRTVSKLGTEGNLLNLTKTVYQEPTANITINGEKLEACPLRLKQGYSLSLLLFNTILEVLANAVREEKEIKGIQIRKEDIKLCLFVDVLIIYVENLKELTKELLELICDYGKLVG